MDNGDMVSSVIAGIGVVIAVVSLVVSGRSARRQTQLQEQVTAIEDGRHRREVQARRHARVTARIAPRQDRAELVLTNHGPAEARSVRFTISAATEGSVPKVLDEELLPLNVLHPNAQMSFPLVTAVGDCTVLLANVAWTDSAGSQKKDFKLRVS